MKIPEYEVTCIKQDGNTVKLSDGEPLNTPLKLIEKII